MFACGNCNAVLGYGTSTHATVNIYACTHTHTHTHKVPVLFMLEYKHIFLVNFVSNGNISVCLHLSHFNI